MAKHKPKSELKHPRLGFKNQIRYEANKLYLQPKARAGLWYFNDCDEGLTDYDAWQHIAKLASAPK